MDFKNYVRMILEAEEAEDKNKKAKDEDDLDDDEADDEADDEEDDDDEASVKTKKGQGCTGCEASVEDEDDEEASVEDDDEDDEDDEDDDEDKKPSLRESIIYSSNYLAGKESTVINEEEKQRVRVLCESIKNNSASKYLLKLSKKAEKETAKWEKKGSKEAAKIARDAAKELKDASTKIRKTEDRYKAGDPTAKKEYKALCKEYHSELKKKGKVAKGLGITLLSLVAGSALLGTAGLTLLANDDIIERLEDGIKNHKLGEVIKGMAVKDKEALTKLIDSAEDGVRKDHLHNIYDHGKFEITRKQIKDTAKDIKDNAYKNDGYHDGRENIVDVLGAPVGKTYKDMFGDKKKK